MGRQFDGLDETLAAWIDRQRLFFVATAPLAADGHINCSPKGLDTLRILGPTEVAYLDLTGSGIETAAHLRENGRIVLMFCAFEGAPKILRLYGQGSYHEAGSAEYDALVDRFPPFPGIRGIVRVVVDRIADSCGFGVPVYAYQEERDTLVRWAESKGEEGLAAYRRHNNEQSLDGLEGLVKGSG